MAGDPDRAALWAFADVFVGALDATNPTTIDDPFGAQWDLVGLLDGEPGFSYAREEEETDHFAWGGVIVRTSRRNFKQTVSFTVLEDNPVTRDLIWPGSSASQFIVPRPTGIKIAFETREENEKVKRMISHFRAEVSLDGEMVDNEGDLARAPLVATIFPDGEGVLFDVQESEPVSA